MKSDKMWDFFHVIMEFKREKFMDFLLSAPFTISSFGSYANDGHEFM